jgi:hypothetical protein
MATKIYQETYQTTVFGSAMQAASQSDEDQYPTELIQLPKNSHEPRIGSQQPMDATPLTMTAAHTSVISQVLIESVHA